LNENGQQTTATPVAANAGGISPVFCPAPERLDSGALSGGKQATFRPGPCTPVSGNVSPVEKGRSRLCVSSQAFF